MEIIKRQNGEIVGVIAREPFSRSGEVVVRAPRTKEEGPNKGYVIPDKACTHNMDRDFEVTHLTFKLTALADGAVTDPQPSVLDRLIQIHLSDLSRNQVIGNAVPLRAVDDESVFRWAPEKPVTMRRGDAWQITIDGRESFDIAFDGQRKRVDAIRVEVAFEGELLLYATTAHRPTIPGEPSKIGVENPLG